MVAAARAGLIVSMPAVSNAAMFAELFARATRRVFSSRRRPPTRRRRG
jgi:hypothetical protein